LIDFYFIAVLDGEIRYMLAIILPVTNAEVAAITPMILNR
jgi:hypothetical protein